MNKKNVLFGLVLVALLVWNVVLTTRVGNVKTEVANIASSTALRFVPLEEDHAQLLNLNGGGSMASSSRWVVGVYNAISLIQQQLNSANQPR